ncbi:redox-sensitive transcriptional activator SoxR [Primorskyibacter aestuariivivens]|uniref:redox-sensitive transcriptional activator SoxR n=1 Tax=Primorskyibacter aestuariivivens TaxID=1888912 RepID=UPI0023009643|nr:redox-sensitive transcriptional activator SoxR [Primorskyibacter aestuariivivens]MDA7430729.1 redox-sensitive transcriptional activator SoxR [Primorskyibacter aestuariivivens]
MSSRGLSIGFVAERTGLSVSAIRFYEDQGLVHPHRNAGGQRAFERSDIRRLSFVLIAQTLGFSIAEIREALASLPENRTPTTADWTRISNRFGAVLDEKIAQMQALRDKLDGCIGCGCLSLDKCRLYNPEDRAATLGKGPRYVMGDEPDPG